MQYILQLSMSLTGTIRDGVVDLKKLKTQRCDNCSTVFSPFNPKMSGKF
jgi:hypothetical protein